MNIYALPTQPKDVNSSPLAAHASKKSEQGLDKSGSVIYVGTFTKMLFNALRIGFIVVPERVGEAFRIARSFIDRHAPTLDQAVLTEFINEGHFGHHVRKMRQVYSDRSQLLTEDANKRLSGLLDVENAQSGMCTVAWIKTRVTEMVLTRRAEQMGVEVVPISSFVSRYEQKPALFLGFAGCNASEIKGGVSRSSALSVSPYQRTLRMYCLFISSKYVQSAVETIWQARPIDDHRRVETIPNGPNPS